MSRPKRIVHIPQLDLTVSLSRDITPAELLVVVAELSADITAHAAKPKP